MKRLLSLIVLLAFAAGVFAGCNESSDNKAASDATNAPAAAATNK